MTIHAVVFDWGGTLSEFVDPELVDAWRLAARHLAPEHEDELVERMLAVEAAFWATTASHQRSATLADLLAAATAELGLDVAEALLEEAAVRHLDAWTPHLRHDPDARPTLAGAAISGAAYRPAVEHPLAPPLPRAVPRAGRSGRADRRPALHQRDGVPEAPSLNVRRRPRRPRRGRPVDRGVRRRQAVGRHLRGPGRRHADGAAAEPPGQGAGPDADADIAALPELLDLVAVW